MFNLDIHDHLITLGYAHTAHEADWEDVGTGETGPWVVGSPGWDEYESLEDRIIVDHRGHVAQWESRDLEFEAWCDEMARQSEGVC
jgi:hypothetical protein